MVVITISRQRGSMGSYVALEVARKLDLRYLDREIIESVAREAGISPESVETLEQRAVQWTRLKRLLGARQKLPAVASASVREQETYEERVKALMQSASLSREAAVARLESGGGLEYAPRPDYLNLITSIVLEEASQGQAMIVGRGSQMMLRGQPGVLHVQVIAKFETRVYNVIQREGVKWREAAHRVRLADEQRAGYMRRFYNVEWVDSNLYDLVLSTDQIPCEVAVDIVVQAAQAVKEAAETAG